MELRDLPAINATLNATAFVLLMIGYQLIRQGKREAHRKVMLAAFTVSAVFLASYLIYHFQVGSVKFQKEGPIRNIYYSILVSHTILAVFVGVMAPMTLFRALRDRLPAHVRIARITIILWEYVSLSGVAVYLMLYQM